MRTKASFQAKQTFDEDFNQNQHKFRRGKCCASHPIILLQGVSPRTQRDGPVGGDPWPVPMGC